MKIDWKFVGLIAGLTIGMRALDTPTWATVFAIAVCTVSNIIGYSDGVGRGAQLMKVKADEFFKELQALMTDTMHRAKEVVSHSTAEAEHLKARLAKYEDVDADRPVH